MSGLNQIRSHLLQLAGAIGVLVLVGMAVLSVNTFPLVGNDSLAYIEHSMDFGEYGLVRFGFRNAGYPLFLAAVRSVAQPLGLDPLLAASILQRLLLLLVAYLAWRIWRWFSLPLIGVLVAPDVLAFGNFILIEGLAVGLAGVTGIATYKCLRSADDSTQDAAPRLLGWYVLVCATTFALFAMRFTLAGFLAIPVIIILGIWTTESRSRLLIVGAVWLAMITAFTLGLSAENSREVGVFRPSFDEYGAEYYYAWTQVFRDPLNQFRPELADYYDDGDVRRFLRETDSNSIPDQGARLQRRRAEIEAMLDTSGMGVRATQIEAAMWALTGGRLHDTARAVATAMGATGQDVDLAIHLNDYSQEHGYAAFAERYNGGQLPGAVVSDSIGVRFLPRGQLVLKLLLPLSIVTAILGLAVPRTRWLAVAALAPVLIGAAGLGMIRADNFRFLLPTAIYTLVLATAIAAGIAREWRAGPHLA